MSSQTRARVFAAIVDSRMKLNASGASMDATERHSLLAAWEELEPHCDSSPFRSSLWQAAWLANLPLDQPLYKVTVHHGDVLIALGVLGLGRSGTWPLTRASASLHATGSNEQDTVFIEQNGFLVRRGYEGVAIPAAIEYLAESRPEVDEFHFDGIDSPEDYLRFAQSTGLIVSDYRMAAPYVDLAAIRTAGKSYMETLNKKARYAVRSARLGYSEKYGPLQVELAANINSALQTLSCIASLNKQRHQGRGARSSFQNEFFLRFHQDLVRRGFASGFAQLLTVTAGQTPVGHLYLFCYRNRIAFYQCGYDYSLLGARAQPGYAALATAIEHYLAAGCDAFDFLAEATPYKLKLAQSSRDMAWLRLRRPSLRNRLTEAARGWWRRPVRR